MRFDYITGTKIVTITGAQVLTTTGFAGLTIMLAGSGRPGNNRVQNKQFRDAARKIGLNPNKPEIKDEFQRAHQDIRRYK